MSLILLGLIQGLSEFFPISSSGHLVIAKYLLKIDLPGAAFEAFLHFGTILAVIVLFNHEIKEIIFSFMGSIRAMSQGKKIKNIFKEDPFSKFAWFLIISTIPAAIIGFCFSDYFESLFDKPVITSLMLSVTGTIIWIGSRLYKGGDKNISDINGMDAIFIGFAQTIAIIPGISRSGMTVLAGLSKGFSRDFAARYSFILSVPIILGATLFKIKEIIFLDINFSMMLLSGIAAFVSSYGAMKIFLGILKRDKMYYFSYYLWIISALTFYLTFTTERIG
ncbi:MAG: undecaprenyl-diphosphate phosphatase [Candidatus Atribacteria bacterium]|nr:undecaprenyl-diphosphate phosphatase [Candidatus Atribacteria bacterium]